MPKRKSDDCDYIKKKIRRLEKKLERKKRKRHHRSRHYSSDSELSRQSHNSSSTTKDDLEDIIDLDAPYPEGEPEGIMEQVLNPAVDAIPSVSQAENTALEEEQKSSAAPEPGPQEQAPTPAADNIQIDTELLDILGTDPTLEKKYGKDINNDISIRFQHWATKGITKEIRKELIDKYITPENCKLIDPPDLNAEVKAAVSEIIAKRDKAIQFKQKELTAGITCLGQAISLMLSAQEKNTELLKILLDMAKIICDCQHADTMTRRNFLLNAVKKDVRESLQNTKIDKQLFGENLAETIKSVKAINKSGTDLKQPTTSKFSNKKPNSNPTNSSRNLNWKGPGPSRRPTGPPRTKEPVMTSTRRRPVNSSKQSQYPQQRTNNSRR